MRIDVVVRPESGHVVPALSVTHALQRIGHDVRFICLGPDAWRLSADAAVTRITQLAPTQPACNLPEHWRGAQMASELARRSWSVAQDWGQLFAGAGAVLIDQTLPDIIFPALRGRLPVIILSTHLSYARRGDTPPLSFPDTDARRGWAVVSEGIAHADRELRALVESGQLPPVMHPQHWRRWAAELRLEDHVVDSCQPLLPGWRGLAELILVPEPLELPGYHRAPGLHYLPPPLDLVQVDQPVIERMRGRLAFCAFGSQLQNYDEAELRHRAQTIVDALALLPELCLALQAPAPLVRTLRLSDRVEARPSWPQRALLQETALFFTHCGVNSMLEAIRAGVPMVAQPLSWDQPGNAMRLEHHGLARGLHDWTPAGVAACAREALALPERPRRAAATWFPTPAEYDARLASLLPDLLEHADVRRAGS